MLTSLPNDWLKRKTFNLCLKVSTALACLSPVLLYLPRLWREGGGRRGGNGVTLHVESALYSDIALEVRDFTKSRSRNRHALLSSEFNLKPKVKNTFEHSTRGGECVGTPANGLQKSRFLSNLTVQVKKNQQGRTDNAAQHSLTCLQLTQLHSSINRHTLSLSELCLNTDMATEKSWNKEPCAKDWIKEDKRGR